VLDQEHGDAALVANAGDKAEQVFLLAAGQPRRRLVKQQQLGFEARARAISTRRCQP
jgi:hypothetical protein